MRLQWVERPRIAWFDPEAAILRRAWQAGYANLSPMVPDLAAETESGRLTALRWKPV